MDFLNLPKFTINTVPIYIDNNTATTITQSLHAHSKTKYIDICYYFIQERIVEIGNITTHRMNTRFNIANIFTKTLPQNRHYKLMKLIGLGNSEGVAKEESKGYEGSETYKGSQSQGES
ncbi:hypothetical protein N8I77_002386 [Diaporthe amygdali]|uniref:Uncharacterized protein n=1 Tax=Phomopsis amygdali TaxID=1214568 RepID=A0AAD9WAC1_PHOAM|nr:hypothetical protein N8I77_002386 [Diaporthe amygdali]